MNLQFLCLFCLGYFVPRKLDLSNAGLYGVIDADAILPLTRLSNLNLGGNIHLNGTLTFDMFQALPLLRYDFLLACPFFTRHRYFTFTFFLCEKRSLDIDNTGVVLDDVGNVIGKLWYGGWNQTYTKKMSACISLVFHFCKMQVLGVPRRNNSCFAATKP